jgi:hypothetical protein
MEISVSIYLLEEVDFFDPSLTSAWFQERHLRFVMDGWNGPWKGAVSKCATW